VTSPTVRETHLAPPPSGEMPTAGKSRLRSILGGALGNLVEWYDWFVYSAFALYFSASFFPGEDQLTQQLSSSGIFAIGFLMRPIGGWLLGTFGDRYGRKNALTLSVTLMCSGSAIIALAPTYATIGVAAPIVLTVARMLQGVSVGGEFGTSATYLAEVAEPERRGFWGSFQYLSLIMGQLLALAVLLSMRTAFSDAELNAWAWRIPFAIGGFLAIVVLWIRRGMVDTTDFEGASASPEESIHGTGLRSLLRHPRLLMIVFFMAAGGNVAFYTFTTYMQKYLVLANGFTATQASMVMAAALFVFMCIQPLAGALSDRIGRKPMLYWFGTGGVLLFYPILYRLQSAHEPMHAFALICAALVIIAGNTSVSATVKAELFPAHIRALGVGLPYAVSLSIFGGSAEYLALWFRAHGMEVGYAIYVTVIVSATLAVFFLITETAPRVVANRAHKSQQ
jgi:MFS transporter, MHS family, alpha-ketoglutarate permease